MADKETLYNKIRKSQVRTANKSANMYDYLIWRGDLTFEQSPYNMVDSLIFAAFCYNDLEFLTIDETTPAAASEGITLRELKKILSPLNRDGNEYIIQWWNLLCMMADTNRFGNLVIHDYVNIIDNEMETQFSALAVDLPDNTVQVAFRGTDNTIVGWREDFALAYETPVPAQESAALYLGKQIDRMGEHGFRGVRVCGHSKGGNLALYSASALPEMEQIFLLNVDSFDGPGLDDDTAASDGYLRIKPIIRSVIPQTSVVGMLMNYHPDYRVVKSIETFIMQHDAFSWDIQGTDFVTLSSTDKTSQILNGAVHQWLKGLDTDTRRQFTDALFKVLSSTNVTTTNELTSELVKNVATMIGASITLPAESKKMLMEVLGKLITVAAQNAFKQN